MTDLFAARSQMALSLGFHIIFAAVGMSMPFLMAVSHWGWLKTKDPVYLKLTKAWSQGVAILFAVGAVSGTALSFELGLLWPKFMEPAGPIIGMPFSWEGTAFFIEAIFLGIFLYGWNRVPAYAHWLSGFIVGISGLASAFFVICANAWMNSPTGFDWVQGHAENIDPWKAMFNPMAWPQGLHMALASFTATGFAVAGIHALGLLKNPKKALHRKAFRIAILFASCSAILLPLQGDRLAKKLVLLQPVKFAAMEALYRTTTDAPLVLGGIPSDKDQTIRFGVEIPGLLSFLAHGDVQAEVQGLDKTPLENRPPVAPTHLAFDLMAGIGTFLFMTSLFTLFAAWKRHQWLWDRRFLRLSVFCLPLGFLAIEAGWTVTEVGRQPWIIYGILRTKDAVTSTPGLFYSMLVFTALYLFLAFVVVWLMARRFRHVD